MVLNFASLILLSTFFCNFVIGIYVIYKNRHKKINIIFGLLILQISLWNAINFLSFLLIHPKYVTFFTQLSLLSVYFIPSTFLYFVLEFIDKPIKTIWQKYMLWAPGLLMIPFTFTRYNVAGFDGMIRGSNFIPGSLYIVYAVYFILFISYGLYLLIQLLRTTKKNIQHYQAQYIIFGMLIAATICITTNAILPFFGYLRHETPSYGTSASIIFGLASAYAITRYRLFDVRAIIKRVTLQIGVSIFFTTVVALIAYSVYLVSDHNMTLLIISLLGGLFLTQLISIRLFQTHFASEEIQLTAPEQFDLSSGPEVIADLLTKLRSTLHVQFNISQCTIMLFNWQEEVYQSVDTPVAIQLSPHHGLVYFMRLSPQIVMTANFKAQHKMTIFLRDEIEHFLKRHSFNAVIPLYTHTNVYGFVFISGKATELVVLGKATHLDLLHVGRSFGTLLQQIFTYQALTKKHE